MEQCLKGRWEKMFYSFREMADNGTRFKRKMGENVLHFREMRENLTTFWGDLRIRKCF